MNVKRVLLVLLSTAAIAAPAFAKGGVGGGGGGGGGGTTTPPPVNPLPQTPPAPGVILRESFGMGLSPDFVRPQGDKGLARQVFAGTSLSGFWLEYPGSWANAWRSQRWILAGASLNPYETLPSPIQADPFNGIAFSDWRDGSISTADAIVPFTGASTTYTLTAEIYPGGIFGNTYLGIGLTSSSALQDNLRTGGQIWVRLLQDVPNDGMHGRYELLIGDTVLASGLVILPGFTPVSFTVDPVNGTVSVVLSGIDLGTFATAVDPRFIALEGQGFVDDLIVRTAP